MRSAASVAIIGIAVWLAPQFASAASPLRVDIPVLVVDSKTATAQGWLTVRNEANEDAPVRLAVADFVSRTTQRGLGTQTELFSGAGTEGSPCLEQTLKAGETLRVRLQVTKLSEAGESVAVLHVNGDAHELRARALDVAFNVTVLQDAADKPAIRFEKDHGRKLLVKNDDAHTYPVAWTIFLPDESEVLAGRATLPPRSTVPISLDAPRAAWIRRWFEGLFKDDVRPAYVMLSFEPELGATVADAHRSSAGLPTRTLATELRLVRWSEGAKAFFGNGIVFLVLLAGGVFSLILGLAVPNRLRRIDLDSRLDGVLRDIRGISGQTDSRLRVALRVERLRLVETVRATRMLSPDTAEQLQKVSVEVAVLARRAGIASGLDAVVRRLAALRQATSSVPPTRIDAADAALQEAIRLLETASPSEVELQKAEAAVQQASALATPVADADPAFATRLAGHFKELRADFDPGGKIGRREACQRLRQQLGDLFDTLGDPEHENPEKIGPGKYHWLDTSVEKLFVLRHYVLRLDDAKQDAPRQGRIQAVEADLVQLLRSQNWNALRKARSLRRACEQDIFVSDVGAQLEKGAVHVEWDPWAVQPNERTRLSVRFAAPGFDECEARREFACVWNFGPRVGTENGWDIVHYFRNAAEAKGTVEFRRLSDGVTVASLPFEVPILNARARAGWWTDRATVETGRLALALVIAVLALLAGAREQLLKVDVGFGLLAVFLLGFGADTIKSLFTKRG
jgi:hypothetical protein